MLRILFLVIVACMSAGICAQNNTSDTSPCYPLLLQTVEVADKIALGIKKTNDVAQQIVDKVPGIQAQFGEILDFVKVITTPSLVIGVAAGAALVMVATGGLFVWTVNFFQARCTCTGFCPPNFDWKSKPDPQQLIFLLAKEIISQMEANGHQMALRQNAGASNVD